MSCDHNWGEDRVYCVDGQGRVPPSPRTDAIPPLEIRSQITIVLAAMIVGQRQEVFRER